MKALNANLPGDIVLQTLTEAAPDFHPRFDARRRAYRYDINNRPLPDPLRRLYSWHVARPLALQPMNVAAAHLVGVHDFATFGQAPQGDNTTREIFRAAWRRDREMLSFEIEGNAFLYRMVRSIVGALVSVGRGDWSVDDFVEAFKARDRSRAAQTAPPHGLVLVSVTYD